MLDFFKLLFDLTKIPYTTSWLSSQINSTPYINSMYGLKCILLKYRIDNSIIKLKLKRDIMGIDKPCIILYRGRFSIITQTTQSQIILLSSANKTYKIPWDDFEINWNGIVLLLGIDKDSGEPNYHRHKQEDEKKMIKLTIFAICCISLIIVGFWFTSNYNEWYRWLFLGFNFLGIIVSIMLMQKQLHISNPLIDKVCSLVKNNGCDKVADSDGANLFGLVTLGEVGATFFIINLMVLIFMPINGILSCLFIVYLSVIPITFWSIWYQKTITKSWCILCLCVILLIWIQIIIFFIGGFYREIILKWEDALTLASLYGICLTCINGVMTLLNKYKNAKRFEYEFNKLKLNEKTFDLFIETTPHFKTDSESCSSLIFGNPEAPYKITLFSNPYCKPCARMHERIKDLPSELVCVSYVMTYFSESLSKINRYIIASYLQTGPNNTWEVLSKWFNGGIKQNESFFEGMHLDIETKEVMNEFKKHNTWKNNYRLYGTPTVIINGFELHHPYTIDDYIYFPFYNNQSCPR